MNLHKQQGAYLVEFVLSYAIFMFLVFGCIEVARMMYTWSALTYVTQRGARVAAVCPVNDQNIAQIAVFGTGSNSNSQIIPGVNSGHIAVAYQDTNGSATSNYADIRYVTVSIENYSHQMLIPDLLTNFVSPDVLSPSFSTTLPAESLGFNPDAATRVCFT